MKQIIILFFAILISSNLAFAQGSLCGKGTTLVNGTCQVDYSDEDLSYRTTGDCLIATASYGTELAPQVQMLREIRDNVLLSTNSGTLFMSAFNTIYYSFAGDIAQAERDNSVFKETVKLFITPMIMTLTIMTLADENSEFDVIFLGTSTIILIVGMYVLAPIFTVKYICRNRK